MITSVKIKDIKQNPFKKFINNGRLDDGRVAKLQESLAHGTLPNSFFARKIDGNWELAHGHHRLEAFKRKYGKDFELDVHQIGYDDETMLVDMVRENLTHRDSDFKDTEGSCVLARSWLESKVKTVKQFDSLKKTGIHPKGKKGGSEPLPDSCRSIAKFLSKQGKAISYETIRNYLSIHDKLAPELHKKVGKIESATKDEKEDRLGIKIATKLATIDDEEAQKVLFKNIQKDGLNHESALKAITGFKDADKGIKDAVKKGKLKLSEVPALIEEQKFEAEVFDKGELPEPDATGKAIALQEAFNKAQFSWIDVLSFLGTGKTVKDCDFSKSEIKSFIKDIEDTNKKELKVVKELRGLL